MSNENSADNSARQAHVEALLAELAMQLPELAPALARLEFRVLDAAGVTSFAGIPTFAAMNFQGHGVILDKFVDGNPELVKMVLAHESLHLVCERVARVSDLAGPAWDGDEMRANVALDRWINQILCDLGLATPERVNKIHGVLPKQGQEQADLMDIWRAEAKQQRKKVQGAMGGCAPQGRRPGEGEGNPSDGIQESPGEAAQRHQEAHSILAGLASMSPTLAKIISPPPSKARWQDVIREAAACARGLGGGLRPTTTRAKLGRRSSEAVPKPGIRTRRPQLVIVVDISGSMTGLLDKVVAESEALASMAHIHLVLHDAAVLFSGQYKKGRDKIAPAGGTTFGPAVQEAARVAAAWDGESVVVHMTDGCPGDQWPDVPSGFRAGYAAIFGGYDIKAPGRWRTRHIDREAREAK